MTLLVGCLLEVLFYHEVMNFIFTSSWTRHLIVGLCMASASVSAAPANALAAVAPGEKLSVPASTVSVSVLAARISGLVCDLCIHDIQKQLQRLPNVTAAFADPREGVAALSLSGPGPTDEAVTKVLTNAGYSVHAVVRSSSVPWTTFLQKPTAAMAIWWGSANEQKTVLATAPAGVSVCAARGQLYSTQHVDTQVWGAGPVSPASTVEHPF
jgi:copper chaperone CopZ